MTDRPNPRDFEDFDDYCAALSKLESLTPAEYSCLLQQELTYGEEYYAESLTQYRSECALFGDAGPGQGVNLIKTSQRLGQVRAQLARINRIVANLAA